MKAYFTSVIDAGRVGLLAGPFDTHEEALALVPASRIAAEEADPWSAFYAFGTCSTDAALGYRGKLHDRVLAIASPTGTAA